MNCWRPINKLPLLRPPPIVQWQPPPMPLDADGKPLPNPFAVATLNIKDQRAIREHDPELAEHLRAIAEHPFVYRLEVDRREQARLRRNEIEAQYIDSENVFKHGSKADQKAFVEKCEQENCPEKVEIYQREIAP